MRVQSTVVLALFVLHWTTAAAADRDQSKGPGTDGVLVSELVLEGVKAVDEDRLRAVLATKERSWWPWDDEQYFDPEVLEKDLERITEFYREAGYPQARVVSSDAAFDADDRAVRIRIVVAEGEAVRLGQLSFTGFEPLGAEPLAGLRGRVPLEEGRPVSKQALARLDELSTHALQERGFAYAHVDVTTALVAPDRMDVVVRAVPGTRAYFGSIEIAGNRSVDDEVVRRELAYRPGDMFQVSVLQESQRRLGMLGLFESSRIEVVDPDARLGEVRTRVSVQERDHRQWDLSLGYGTEEKLNAELVLRHVNFLGGARNASVHGRVSWLDRGVEGRFIQPYLFRPGLSLSLRGHAWYTDEPAYSILSRGGEATIAYALGPRVRTSVTYVHEVETSRVGEDRLRDAELRDDLIQLGLDPRSGEQDGVLSALVFDVSRQTIDNPIDPTRGYATSIRLEQAGRWLPGTFNYTNAAFDVRAYRTVHGATFAGRARYAAISPARGDADVPFFKRYFLGGAANLRGWGRFEVSPLSATGLPIGGYTSFSTTGELRVPIAFGIGAVAFLDSGRVWPDDWDFRLGDLLYDAGVGMRWNTALGPVRFDYGYQLTPLEGLRIDGRPQERRWRVHFSIGQTF